MARDSLTHTAYGPVSRAYEESKMPKPARGLSLVVALVCVSSASALSVAFPAPASEPGLISGSPARHVCVS